MSSSIPEERNAIIQKCIPKLISNLTNFSPNEENYKLCLQFAWSHIKYHRFMTVNVHEVKRDIEGICEKFKLNNFHEEEKEFRKICENTVTHEIAVNHYEKDVMYSIVNLLTTLAYDPIGKLKDRKRKGLPVFMRIKKFEDLNTRESKNFMDSLLEDNFKFTLKNDSESELSEWSEDDEIQKSTSESENEEPKGRKMVFSPSLYPPKKPEIFKTITLGREESKKWLDENVQNCWWKIDEITHCEVHSSHPAANFCLEWQRHLIKRSLGFIKPQPISLVSEYCLLREIFWMFSNAVDCKFFKFEKNEISLRSNVSLPSTSPHSLHAFLKDIVSQMNIMHKLKSDYKKSSIDFELSYTLENYYSVLNVFLNEILDFIVKQENIVKEQNEPYTIIKFQNEFRPHAKLLKMLWNIHSTSILDETRNPPHITTLHLLASLNNHIYEATKREKRNLAITLLISSLKTYMNIFDIWWTEARLHDLKMEFIVERVAYEETVYETIFPRLIEKCKERSFYINESVSNRILSDPLVELMKYFATEASASLEIIAKLDRVHEMKQIKCRTKSLYEDFMEIICQEIKEFASNDIEEKIKEDENSDNEVSSINQKVVNDVRNEMMIANDDLMELIFESTFKNLTSSTNRKKETSQVLDIYKMLDRGTDSIFIPLENRIEKNVKELLSKKISVAEKFVIDIYFNEFFLDHRFKEVRQVFFLESNELMNYYNLKLFPQMENCETWANPYLMTVALNEAIFRDQPHKTIFTVNVNKKLRHLSVLDAIDEIEIRFNMDDISENIFSNDVKKKYNEVFRFLLKIKYGLRILNCLLYPEFFKRRSPFAKLTMLDLVIKRLALTRFSMQQALNTIHNQIMVVLQGLSLQLDESILKSERINEIISLHKNFVDACYRKSYLNSEAKRTKGIIIEMLKLSKVIKDEWHNIETFYALDSVGKIDDTISLSKLNVNTIEIEKAYKACENHLKDLLD
ncbi:hypothetical protein PVAND_009728 [Polypedilum vanderplanki]|uniref:Gamma-tubulin complex component n=1 Tax=Polypedilum vanderplanki TaxID=319348 RepID=A0A9J6CEJ7_POLVA|nr:hypothetical protein PVAND_009728 [Polypedilum vanderplanki]